MHANRSLFSNPEFLHLILDWRRISVFGAGILSSAAFVGLAEDVMDKEIHEVDNVILQFADGANFMHNALGRSIVQDITALGGLAVLVLITAIVFFFLQFARQRLQAWFLLFSVLSGSLTMTWLKNFFNRARPEDLQTILETYTASFPSGHSMISAIVYLSLASMLARTTKRLWKRIFYFVVSSLLVILVGVSRVLLGVHYPSDVLAGWCAGVAWVCFSHLLIELAPALRAQEKQQEAENRAEGVPQD